MLNMTRRDVSGGSENRTLSNVDVAVGTVIALAMGAMFFRLSSGMSLIVTFLPGLAFAWLAFVTLKARGTALPDAAQFLPIYIVTLAVQFLHFAEEYLTGFPVLFPALYGGQPYALDMFVSFNMLSYFVFAVGAVLALTQGVRFLLLPVLFFIVYGAIGNAISHTWWSVHSGAYFPGLFTAQLYWVLGPLVLYRILGSVTLTFLLVGAEAATLVVLLMRFQVGG